MTTEQQPTPEVKKTKSDPFSWFQGLSKASHYQKISHALITPATTFQQALAKTYIANEQQLNQIVQFYTELQDSGLGEDATPPRNQWNHLVINWLIGSPSIKGLARAQASQVDIGVFDQMTHAIRMTGKSPDKAEQSKKFGILKNKKDKGDDNND